MARPGSTALSVTVEMTGRGAHAEAQLSSWEILRLAGMPEKLAHQAPLGGLVDTSMDLGALLL